MLLSSFGAESLQSSKSDDEPNKLQEAIDRIVRFTHWVKMSLLKCAKHTFNKKRPANIAELPKIDVNGKKTLLDGHAIIGNGKFGDKIEVDENAVTPTNQGRYNKQIFFLFSLLYAHTWSKLWRKCTVRWGNQADKLGSSKKHSG